MEEDRVHINTDNLDDIQNELMSCRHNLADAADAIVNDVRFAGNFLEGNQYDLSVSKAREAYENIEQSVQDISNIEDYLDRLKDHIIKYSECMYEG